MIMNIIFFACFMPVALIIFFVMRNEAKAKKNIIIGVTLPLDARESQAVHEVTKTYLTRQNIVAAILLGLLAPQFFFRHMSVVMTWYFGWLIAVLVLPSIPYIIANRKLMALKVANGWFSESSNVRLVDLKVAAAPKKRLSVWLFIPAVLLTLAPVIHTAVTLRGWDEFWPMLLVYGMFAVMAIAFYFLYRINFRQRADVVDDNTSVNAALTQVRRYNWNKIWLLITWLTAFFDITFWLFRSNAAVILILTTVYTLVLIFFVVRAEQKTRSVQQKLTEESGRSVYTDDDDHWIFGMLYNNPDDTHFIVNKRVGVGTTINLAKVPAKILMGFIALILLAMPLVGVWLMNEESAAVRLETSSGSIVARHTGVVYDIAYSDIESAYLLDTLPKGTRTMGTAMDSVLKGNFRLDGIGDCRLCLDPRTPPFVVITAGGNTYILGSSILEETGIAVEAFERAGIGIRVS